MNNDLEVTAYIMGIAHPQRLEWLLQNIDILDQQDFIFKDKIVSIDQFDGYYVSQNIIDYLTNKKWKVLLDSHRSRIASMDRAFNEIKTEYVFYNEDDVISILPSIEVLKDVFDTKIEGKKCSMISMTLGGTQYDAPSKNIGDLAYIEKNKIIESNDFLFFKRLEEFKNDWFFEFPGLWIRTEIFKNCHNLAKNFGGQIEKALTKAYFYQNLDKTHYKSSVCKKNTLNILLNDPFKVNSHCRFLTNLDPLQGNSAFGGNHNY